MIKGVDTWVAISVTPVTEIYRKLKEALMKILLLMFSLLWLFLPLNMLHASENHYVSSAKAKLMDGPEFRAEVLAELERGTEIQVINQQGPWLEVQLGEKTGWVSRMLTSSTPPMERISVLGGNEESNLRDVRRRTSAITTAAAARGLAASRQEGNDSIHPSDYQALELMESIEVSAEELEAFARPLGGIQ